MGQTVASRVLAMRAHDHSADPTIYTPGSGIGMWVPTPPAHAAALEAGWGKVTPFVLDAASQFRPAPPPRLGSESYVRDYLEIVRMGAASGSDRNVDQSTAARFWITTAAQSWNQLVRQVTVARGLDAAAAARAYLVLNVPAPTR